MAKAANYSTEDETKITMLYEEAREAGLSNKDALASINDSIPRGARSLRAKLSHMGVYVADEAKSKTRPDGPTKKELLAALRDLKVFPEAVVDGLMPASKPAIEALLDMLEVELNEYTDDSDETDAEPEGVVIIAAA